jgi:signal peptidase II
MRAFVLTAIVIFVLDQALKWLVVVRLDLINRGVIDVWPPFLTLRMAWNRGINFGLFGDYDLRWVLIAVALAICVWVVTWARSDRRWPVQVAGGLLVGGALGNVIDRITWGAVADFLNMSCCGIANPYAFNIADIAIFAGAFGLILVSGGKKDP